MHHSGLFFHVCLCIHLNTCFGGIYDHIACAILLEGFLLHLTIPWTFAHIRYSSKTGSWACLQLLIIFFKLYSRKTVALCAQTQSLPEGTGALAWAPSRSREVRSTDPCLALKPGSVLHPVWPWDGLPDFLAQGLVSFFCKGADEDCLHGHSSWAVTEARRLRRAHVWLNVLLPLLWKVITVYKQGAPNFPFALGPENSEAVLNWRQIFWASGAAWSLLLPL